MAVFIVVMSMVCSCQPASDEPPTTAMPAVRAATHSTPYADVDLQRSTEAWQRQRREEIQGDGGWSSLAGLYWLRLKQHFVGQAVGNGVRLTVGPPNLGMVERNNRNEFFFVATKDVPVTYNGEPFTGRVRFYSDVDSIPSVIGFDSGKGKLTLIRRGDRFALRVRHADVANQAVLPHVGYWPVDGDWRIQGRFIPHAAGHTLRVGNILGSYVEMSNPGIVEFHKDGRDYRLETIGPPGERLSIVFADLTSGEHTYPTGRYLDIEPPDEEGNVTLDFNRAYNPPCVFTKFSTCLLSPRANYIDLEVAAGERYVSSE